MASNAAQSPRSLPEDSSALRDELIAVVYDQLRSVAAKFLQYERPDHTLQPTALVHEAYLRLSEQQGVNWKDEKQVITLAALMMRRVLIDHAKAHRRKKRGGDLHRIDISDVEDALASDAIDVLALDEALDKFSASFPLQSKIVELRFFGGLSIQETAEVLELSEATIKREFRFARAWLFNELGLT